MNMIKELITKFKITGVASDSREVKHGDMFFAMHGKGYNGEDFIQQALKAGAHIAITDNKELQSDCIIYSNDIKSALLEALDLLYPTLPDYIVAVTGTNGKTSVVSYCRQLFNLLGERSGSIGTLGLECNGFDLNEEIGDLVTLTTPSLVSLRKILHFLAKRDCQYVALEASSQGLDQGRLGGIKVEAAAFTSFGRDHLDYHGNIENYLNAKLHLFTDHVVTHGTVVINGDTEKAGVIQDKLSQFQLNTITVGKHGDLKINSIAPDLHKQTIRFAYQNKGYSFTSTIPGKFQIINLLIAATLVHNAGFSFDDIVTQLSNVHHAKGRLARITGANAEYQIFVDYAHSPDALKTVLQELSAIIGGNAKLVVLFGCGGNRDKEKRAIMGKIANEIADLVIITDDNPRYEDPATIRSMIISGAPNAIEIANRAEAIRYAVKLLNKGDILLVAGKGHEEYQDIQGKKIVNNDTNDTNVIKESLRGKGGKRDNLV